MRRRLIGVVVAAILAITTTAVATEWESFNDTFETGGYSGNDGSLSWSGPWAEDGESTNPGAGAVRVVQDSSCQSGRCLRVNAALLGSVGAHRIADSAGLVGLELRYDIRRQGGISVASLLVQVSDNGASGWQTVRTLSLGSSDGSPVSYSNDISGYVSETTGVRFITSSVLSLGASAHIDNVEILGVAEEAATTTTTTAATTSSSSSTSTSSTSTSTTSTSTTSTSTTSTAATSTTTTASDTVDDTTTTTSATGDSRGSTTTTQAESTPPTNPRTSTTRPSGSDGSSASGPDPSDPATTPIVDTGGPGSGGTGSSPDEGGIRAAATGIQANFQGDLYGEVRKVSSLNGVDLQADYRIAVEVIRSSWAWMVLLGLLIAWAIVSGLDGRRNRLDF